MSKRLQVILKDVEMRDIQRIARRHQMTVAEWVRQALRAARKHEPETDSRKKLEVVRAAKMHSFPTGEIDQILAEIMLAAKRRKESIEAFKEGGREDLVLKEGKELAILEEYLPEQLSSEELKGLIQEAIESTGASSPRDMGKVMKVIMPEVQGKADGKVVNLIVKELLSS